MVSVRLDEPVIVASGDTFPTRLRVHNHQSLDEEVVTNGHITARVVDPSTEDAVGGYSGPRRLPRVVFHIRPGDSAPIPILVGTASSRGELGYAIPPGEWSFGATVTLRSGMFRTPPLPLTIVTRDGD